MKLWSMMVYVSARLQVKYTSLTRRIASDKRCEDTLAPALVPSVVLGDCRNRVLAEIDQEGFAFAVDQRDTVFFNTKTSMNPRRHHRIQIVLTEGAVCLRKSIIRKRHTKILDRIYDFLRWEFYIETAALLRLRELACVPTIRRIDYSNGSIEMDYIWGRDLRQILANGKDGISCEEISRSFSALFAGGCQSGISTQITATISTVMRHGVIPRDIHAANFIQGQQSKKLYMIDFNLVHLRPVPGWRSYARDLSWLLKNRADEVVVSRI
jgi:tRNA A-37 threonylcarbamoyl transferase component Bud32